CIYVCCLYVLFFFFFFFFFQAEDGIRDRTVTGVQTCALPIWPARNDRRGRCAQARDVVGPRRAHVEQVFQAHQASARAIVYTARSISLHTNHLIAICVRQDREAWPPSRTSPICTSERIALPIAPPNNSA